MKLYYSEKYLNPSDPFETFQKAGWIAESLQTNPMEDLTILPPLPLTDEQLLMVHSVNHVWETKNLGCITSFSFVATDPQALENGLYSSCLHSNGGAVAAALSALKEGVSGSLSTGLHHAKKDYGEGFCTFNGLVIAAEEAIKAGAKRVLILDLDAHCGGGTYSMIRGSTEIYQLDIATNRYDKYLVDCDNARLRVCSRDYLKSVGRYLCFVDRLFPSFDLCLYNAGVDPYNGVTITEKTLQKRDELVFSWAARKRLPVAFVIAGGYLYQTSRDGLVGLHRQTISAAISTSKQYGGKK